MPMKQMKQMKQMMVCIALAAMLGACGGGGGGGGGDNPKPEPVAKDTTTTPPLTQPITPAQPQGPFTVLGDQSLPGRIVVSAAAYASDVYDLQTGIGTVLPTLKEDREHSDWIGSDSSPYIVQTTEVAGNDLVYIFKTSDLQTPVRKVTLPGDNNIVGVSPNGQYILAFLFEGGEHYLTVYNATTGAVVKQRSYIPDGEMIMGTPAAWMRENRYVYFHKAKLYEASPDSFDDAVLVDLEGRLPYNSSWDGGRYITQSAKLTINPQNTKLAFVWEEMRDGIMDAHIWVLDNDGGLRRLTATATPKDASSFVATQPAWSPDGQWIIGVMPLGGTGVAPVFPNPEDTLNPAWEIVSGGGCDSQLFALPASAHDVPLDRYKVAPKTTLKVRTDDGKKATWLTKCATPGLAWLSH